MTTNPDTRVLPDTPGEWGEELPDGYRQRWLPGAFGDRTTLQGVERFKVSEDRWEEDADGKVWRTIVRAESL